MSKQPSLALFAVAKSFIPPPLSVFQVKVGQHKFWVSLPCQPETDSSVFVIEQIIGCVIS